MANDLLTDIQHFLTSTGMSKSYFGKVSCGNSELVGRLEEGKTVTLVTADKVRLFMADRSTPSEQEPVAP